MRAISKIAERGALFPYKIFRHRTERKQQLLDRYVNKLITKQIPCTCK